MSQFMLCESRHELYYLGCIPLLKSEENKDFLYNIADDIFGKDKVKYLQYYYTY